MLVENTLNMDDIVSQDNLIENFLKEYDGSSPVILYGIGAGVDWHIKLLNSQRIPITCLTDSRVQSEENYNSLNSQKSGGGGKSK